MTISKRNDTITKLLDSLFWRAKKNIQKLDASTEAELDLVFSSTAWGFREILLVVSIARYLNPSFKASDRFYDCNPRALFEGPIRAALLQRGIPHKKSGPLNVAKAAVGINNQWAAQRRPANVAAAVVILVKKIESITANDLEIFLQRICQKLLTEAVTVKNLNVTSAPKTDHAHLFRLCFNLISNTPDAGNTPQKIVGLLMQAYHESMGTGIQVRGLEHRASVTSTTSKKYGDITEESSAGDIYNVFEVTVKPFGQDRVRESYESYKNCDKIYERDTREAVIICRFQDLHPSATGSQGSIYLGKLDYLDFTYHFVDIFEWVLSLLARMTSRGRLKFYEKLNSYITDPNTAEKVKRHWKELHEQNKESSGNNVAH